MPYITDLIGANPDEYYVVGLPSDMGWFRKAKKRVHILALGDVGGLLLTGLRLRGASSIESIGIFDVREAFRIRYEMEMNQVLEPWAYEEMPEVRILDEKELFDCDVFVFCASLGVPPVTEKNKDVRMAQLEANGKLIQIYARKALLANYQGLFAVVSDPVDPLCQAAAAAGFPASHIKGYGLGVMNARAAYYAKKDSRFASFLTEGAAFGPHGQDLVIANSIEHYDDALSRELTDLTVRANIAMRELGFKPYMAPALSSGALSLLATIEGRWHYSSTAVGNVFLGAKNRVSEQGIQVENPRLPEALFARIQTAYENLKAFV